MSVPLFQDRKLVSNMMIMRRSPMMNQLSAAWTRIMALAAMATGLAMVQPAQAQAPANDNFANATVLPGFFFSTNGTTINATFEPNEPLHDPFNSPGGHSVWYVWTATTGGTVTFNTFGSSFDTVLAAYIGNSVGALIPVAKNDDAPGLTLDSSITFTAFPGQQYRIAVDGYQSDFGNFQLNMGFGGTPTPPQNDNFANPTVLTGTSGTVSASNSYATKETGEPNHANQQGGNSVWFEWTSPINGEVTFDTFGSNFDTLLGIYTGNAINNLGIVGSNDNSASGTSSQVSFQAQGGTVYRIAVDGVNLGNGAIVLNWRFSSAAGEFRWASDIVNGNGTLATFVAREAQSFSDDNPILDKQLNPLGARLTVTRINGSTGRMLVDYRVTGGSAIPGTHYSSITANGTLVFDDYQMSADIIVELGFTGLSAAVDLNLELVNARPDVASGEDPTLLPSIVAPSQSRLVIESVRDRDLNFARSNYMGLEGRGVQVRFFKNVGGGTYFLEIFNPFNTFALQPGSDYTLNQASEVPTTYSQGIPGGIGTYVFNIPIPDDLEVEFNEDWQIQIRDAAGNRVVDRATVTTLFDAPSEPSGIPVDREQPPGAVDRDYNMNNSLLTSPPLNDVPGANGDVAAVAIQTDQKALIGGYFTKINSFNSPRIGRLNTDGSFDTSFTPGLGPDDVVSSIGIQTDDRIIIGGDFQSYDGNLRGRIARLQTNGVLDATFNPGVGADGLISTLTINKVTNAVDFGKIIIAGEFNNYNGVARHRIARLNIDGSLDDTFDPGAGPDAPIRSITIQKDGRVIVGGEFRKFDGVPRNGIARLNPDGSLDSSFNPGGGANGDVYAVSMDSPTSFTLRRQASGGAAEDRFLVNTGSTNGTIVIDYNFLTVPDSLTVIYQGTQIFQTQFFSNNFVIDPATGLPVVNTVTGLFEYERQTISIDYSGASTTVEIVINLGNNSVVGTLWDYNLTIFPKTEGQKVLMAGNFTEVDLRSRRSVARLNEDGTLDTSFDPGFGFDGPVYAIGVQGDGLPVFGGQFSEYNLTRRMGLARLFSDGSLDTGFMDTAYNQFAGLPRRLSVDSLRYINSIGVLLDGNMIVGGRFTEVGGGYFRDDRLPRYNFAQIVGGDIRGPGNIGFTMADYTVDENDPEMYISLVRTNGSLGPISATFATSDRPSAQGAAASGTDYLPTVSEPIWISTYNLRSIRNTDMHSDALQGPNFASFGSPPNTAFTITTNANDVYITVLDDNVEEGDELVNLSLVRPRSTELLFLGGVNIPLGSALGRSSAVLTIADNDFSNGIFGFAQTNIINLESEFATVEVVRTNGSHGRVSVQYQTLDQTAIGASSVSPVADYITTSGILVFEDGETNKFFQIPIINDVLAETNEFVSLRLLNPTGGAILDPSVVPTNSTLVIVDDDYASGNVSFSSSAFSIQEGGQAQITLIRSGGGSGAVTVTALLTQSAAINAAQPSVDYDPNPVGGVLSWNDGETGPKSFLVSTFQDVAVEGDEVLNLTLNITGALPGVIPTSVLTILEDDSAGNFLFSQPNYLANENGGPVIVTINRVQGNAGPASFNVRTIDGTASSSDYVPRASQTIELAPGQVSTNISIGILDDTAQTGNLDFQVEISGPYVAGGTLTSTVIIIDNESVNVPAGSADTTFKPNAGTDGFIHSLLVQPDQRIVVGGNFTTINGISRNRISRLLSNGELDPNFNPGQGADGAVRTVSIYTNGLNQNRLIVGGLFDKFNGTNMHRIARLNVDGTVDLTFNPGAGPNNPVYSTAIQSDGRVLVGGSFNTFNGINRSGIVRLLTNGVVDASFQPGQGANGIVYDIVIQPDGKIILAGDFTIIDGNPRNYIARLNADGSLDPTFNAGVGPDSTVRALLLQPDGKIVLGGSFMNINGTPRSRLARLESDGSHDLSFDPVGGADDTVLSLALEPGGKFLVGGNFNHFGGVTRRKLTRLHSDGSTDVQINFGTGANNFVETIGLQADGKILVGGAFTSFNEQPKSYLVRVHGGTIEGSGALRFLSGNFTASENGGSAVVTVLRTGGTAGTVTGTILTENLTAIAPDHYANTVATLTFGPAETLQTLSIPIVDNSEVSSNRVFRVRLSGLTGGAVLGAQPVADVEIVNDDGRLGFSQEVYRVNENAISSSVLVTVSREGSSQGPASVSFTTTTNGTATAGLDYLATNGVLSFADGEVSKSFAVRILEDALVEVQETIGLQLTNFTGAVTPGRDLANVVIVDNEVSPGEFNFLFSDFVTNENAGAAVITVTRTNGTTGAVSVNFATADGTANVSSNDYTGVSGLLSFGDGEISKSFTIPINLDLESETNETVNLSLSNPQGGAVLGPQSTARLTIINNDILIYGNLRFTATNFTVSENGGSATLSVERFGSASNQGAIGATVVTTSGTALDGQDFNGVTNILSWAHGEGGVKSFTIPIVDNLFVQGDKFLVVSLTNTTGGVTLGVPSTATLTIQDDDSGPGVLTFELSRFLVAENGTNAVVTVSRTNGVTSLVSADFRTYDVSAKTGVDYTGLTNTLIFADGQSSTNILIPVFNNSLQEGSLTVGLQLLNPINTTLGRADSILLIQDDERPSGSVDLSFTPGTGANDIILDVGYRTQDADLFIAGLFTDYDGLVRTNLARLNFDGSPDPGLNVGDVEINDALGSIETFLQITNGVHAGKLIVAGRFNTIQKVSRNFIARLNADGTLDSTFTPATGANGPILALARQNDGRIVAGGEFTQFDGFPAQHLVRLNTDGTYDSTFTTTNGPSAKVRSILVDGDGTMIVAGDFQSVGALNRNRIARLNPNGEVDKDFDPGAGFNGNVHRLLLLPDGKILAAGAFTQFNNLPYGRLIRLLSDGSLDLSFSLGGVGADDFVNAMALDSTGNIIVGGAFTHWNGLDQGRLARLLPDGLLDLSFNVGLGANDFISDLLVQPDGKLIVVGGFTSFDGVSQNHISRLNTGRNFGSGSISFSLSQYLVNENSLFASIGLVRQVGLSNTVSVTVSTADGTALSGLDYSNTVKTVVFQPGQTFTNVLVPIVNNDLIDGDRTVFLSLSDPQGGAILGDISDSLMIIQSEDAVIGLALSVASVTENAGAIVLDVDRAGGTNSALTVSYTLADGSARADFDYFFQTGQLTFTPGATNRTVTISLINDSGVEGDETFNVQLFGLQGPGLLGNTNTVVTIVDDEANQGVIQFELSDYQVSEGGTNAVISLIRTNGANGIVSVQATTVDATAFAGVDYTAVQEFITFADGETYKEFTVPILDNLVVSTNGSVQASLFLSNPTAGSGLAGGGVFGSLDTNFNQTTTGPDNNTVRAIGVETGGQILMAGDFTSFDSVTQGRIVRVNPDGTLDTSFIPGTGANGIIQALDFSSNGQAVIAGNFTSYNGVGRIRLARLNLDGTLDLTLDPGTGANASILDVAVDRFNRMVIAGNFTSYDGGTNRGVARVNVNGSSDTNFLVSANNTVNAVAIQSDGSILIGGDFTTLFGGGTNVISANRVARILPNGTLDLNFNAGLGADGEVLDIGVQSDGKIIVVGRFANFDGQPFNRIVRLNSNGSLDLTYDPGFGPDGDISVVLIQPDDKIIVGGAFNSFDGIYRRHIERLEFDGSRDNTFNPGIAADADIHALALQTDGNLLIGGAFTMFNGVNINRMARLQPGTVFGLAVAMLTIFENDVVLGFQTNQFSVAEDAGLFTVDVQRSGLLAQTIEVDFTTLDGTAFDTLDYQGTNGILTFLPGETNKTFQVSVINDTLVEGDETFGLQLVGRNNASLIGTTDANVVLSDVVTFTDLSVHVSAADPIFITSNFTYNVTVSNSGPATATGVFVTDLMPSGIPIHGFVVPAGVTITNIGSTVTADLGTVAPFNSVSFQVLSQAPGTTGFLTNIATVAYTEQAGDPDFSNNQSAAVNRVRANEAFPALARLVLVSEGFVPANGAIDAGETVTVRLDLQNIGTRNTTNLVVTLQGGGVVQNPSAPVSYGVLTTAREIKQNQFAFTANGTNGQSFQLTFLQQESAGFNYDNIVANFTLGTSSTGASATPIVIPDVDFEPITASPYPSIVNISGLTGIVSRVTLTLSNISHTFPDDLDMLLVAPSGQAAVIWSDAGGGNALTNVTVTLDDNAFVALPNSLEITNGVYRPTNYFTSSEIPDQFPLPAPSGPYGTTLASFNGIQPNGDWLLYVMDDNRGDGGSIAGGWSLNVESVVPLESTAGLSVDLVATTNIVSVGNQVTYTLSVTNIGPNTANNVELVHTLGSGLFYSDSTFSQGTVSAVGQVITFQLGSIASGSNAVATVTVNATTIGATFTTASVTALETDPFPGNNAARHDLVVNPSADLAAVVSQSNNPALLGSTNTYTISVTNSGPSTATSVVVTNRLVGPGIVLSATASQGSAIVSSSEVIFNLGSINANGSASLQVATRPSATGVITNLSTVVSQVQDPVTNNNVAVAITTSVSTSADLAVSLVGTPDPVLIGSNLTFRAVVANNGPSTASGVILTNPLPNSVNFVSAITSQGSSTVTNGVFLANLGSIPPGSSATVDILVVPTVPGLLNAVVGVAASTADPVNGNNVASEQIAVQGNAALIVAGDSSLLAEGPGSINGAIDSGETVTMSFSLRNKGATDTTSALTATLLSSGGVSNPSAPQNYGILVAGGDAVARSFTFTASGAVGSQLVASLQLQDGATELGVVNFSFRLGGLSSFTNSTEIVINPVGPASPYPSSINVSGLDGTLLGLEVTLNGFNHSYPDDVDILLQAPDGRTIVLMSDAGGGFVVFSPINLTFAEGASVPGDESQLTTGRYAPVNYATVGNTNDVFDAPTNPAFGTRETSLGAFTGMDPNGTWRLFVMDDTAGDQGVIAGGWNLAITTLETANTTADLRLVSTVSTNLVFSSQSLTYEIQVFNLGQTATNVVLTNVFDSSVQVSNISTTSGTYTNLGASQVFQLGNLNSGQQALISMTVTPGTIGFTTMRASAVTTSPEALLTNNATTNVVEVQAVTMSALGGMSGSGQFSISLSGRNGTTYVIQSSTNLVDWIPVATNTVVSGSFEFTDSEASTSTLKFYRAVEQ